MRGHDENLLEGLRPPAPTRELRDRTLRAAREAMSERTDAGLWDRIWESRALRTAWLSVTFALLAAHAAVSLFSDPPVERSVRRAPLADQRDAGELKEIVDLPQVGPSKPALEGGPS
jgi:hypothetical protein